MSANKKLVEAVAAADKSTLGPLLADDVEWVEWADGVPATGALTRGRDACLQNYGNDQLRTEITRMTEENNVVVAEGTVHVHRPDGKDLTVRFCNIYELEAGRVKRKTSFGALVQEPA